jgi:hypothetical protein
MLEGFEEQVFLKQEADEATDLQTDTTPHRLHPRRLERRHPG